MKTNIKKGDQVEVISGKYKGKFGKVSLIIKEKHQLIVENINIKTKHVKPKTTENTGYIKKIEKPIHYSNVKLIKNLHKH
uniref:Large ribosomal subunit protein uL24c n=1 Tax=Periphykon beckeri TaxID=2006982 RepID=A0A1Z1M3F3_9FLOR|nr:ribosomal protein L24 [Periphykon beckeri]ARW60452.1 ribosomal protein L24 [Periphykon beckeri]